MLVDFPLDTAPFNTIFFPQHVTLLSTGEYMIPMGYWTVISKDPFRFLICMQLGNYSLELLRKNKEATLHFFPWGDRERVLKTGYISGRDGSKAERLGFNLLPAEKMQHTKLVEGYDSAYETADKPGTHRFICGVCDFCAGCDCHSWENSSSPAGTKFLSELEGFCDCGGEVENAPLRD